MSLMKKYEAQCREWDEIRDQLIDARRNGEAVTAFQVTTEQRKRMLARGERMVTYEELVAEAGVIADKEQGR